MIQTIARSLQVDIAPPPEPDESDANGSQSPDTEDTKHLDEHGNRHPLLVMLESLEPLGPEDDFPEIYDPPVTVRNDNP